MITSLIELLKASRNDDDDDAVRAIFNASEELCVKCDIETTLTTRRKRKLPKRLADSVIEQSVGQRHVINSQADFRQHV